jgi:hypothetical protein
LTKHGTGLGKTVIRTELREKMIAVCTAKIARNGPDVGLSFYAFFKNRNDNPALLMEAARWWIETHRLDHFVQATKVRALIEEMGA